MQRTSSIVVSVSRLKGRTAFLLLIGAFILGMLYGVLLLRQDAQMLEQMQFLIGQLLSGGTLLESFFHSSASALFYLFSPYLLGYSAIGQPLILLIPFFKGLGLGAFLGSLYAGHGIAGIGYSVLIVIPASVILLFSLLIGCREAMRLSNMIFSNFFAKTPSALGIETVKLYNIKFLILFGIAILSAAVSSICLLLFSGLFSFG